MKKTQVLVSTKRGKGSLPQLNAPPGVGASGVLLGVALIEDIIIRTDTFLSGKTFFAANSESPPFQRL
jgi:hypothetical protein